MKRGWPFEAQILDLVVEESCLRGDGRHVPHNIRVKEGLRPFVLLSRIRSTSFHRKGVLWYGWRQQQHGFAACRAGRPLTQPPASAGSQWKIQRKCADESTECEKVHFLSWTSCDGFVSMGLRPNKVCVFRFRPKQPPCFGTLIRRLFGSLHESFDDHWPAQNYVTGQDTAD